MKQVNRDYIGFLKEVRQYLDVSSKTYQFYRKRVSRDDRHTAKANCRTYLINYNSTEESQ